MSLTTEQLKGLKSNFANLNEIRSATAKPSNADEINFVLELLITDIGMNVAFEIRQMLPATKAKLAKKFKFDVNTNSHELSLAIAKILRASKEHDVKIADANVALINEPQLAHQPSKWAVMSIA